MPSYQPAPPPDPSLKPGDDEEDLTDRSGSFHDSAGEIAQVDDEVAPLRTPEARATNRTASMGSWNDEISLASNTTAPRSNTRRTPTVRYRRCVDHYQIDLDVARCTWHLLTGDQRAQRYQMEHKRNRQVARIIRRKQRRLGLFINVTLVHSDDEGMADRLRYYQGYHDVACIFLTTLAGGQSPTPQLSPQMTMPAALELPARVLCQVSRSHLRDYLKDNFVDLQTALRLTVFPLLAVLDPLVHDHLYAAEMEPFFCLSWVITWFAHEVRDSATVKRLFDAFLVGHPLLPLYASIAMVLHPINRLIVLREEPDFAMLHQTLRGLPRNSSMAGWKYRPGDGYVSDDEEDEDDDEEAAAAGEARLDAAVDGDIHQLRSVLDRDNNGKTPNTPTGAASSVSTGTNTASTSEAHARVPFQELLDLAVRLMQKIPPRQLMSVAQRYYGRDHVQSLLKETNSVALMGELVPWAIQPTLSSQTPRKEIQRTIRQKRRTKAVLALGLGLSDADRRNRRRRRFWFGVAAVALLAVVVVLPSRGCSWQRLRDVLSPTSDSAGSTPPPPPDLTPSDLVGNAMRKWNARSSAAEAVIGADGSVVTEPAAEPIMRFAQMNGQMRAPGRPGGRSNPPRASSRPSRKSSAKMKPAMRSRSLASWFVLPAAVHARIQNELGRLFRRQSTWPAKQPMLPSGKKKTLKQAQKFLNKPFRIKPFRDGMKVAVGWLNAPFRF